MTDIEIYTNCYKLVEKLTKDKHNTSRIRNKVYKELLKYLNSIEYFKESNDFDIICDETNNSTDIIENNMICVSVYKKLKNNYIKHIDVKYGKG